MLLTAVFAAPGAALLLARATLSDAISTAVQGAVFPAIENVQCNTFPSGPGPTSILFLMLLRLLLTVLACCATTVRARKAEIRGDC